MKILCSWFNADMEVETPSTAKTITLTYKQAASLMEVPLSAVYHLIETKAVKAVRPEGLASKQIKMSAAEIMLVREAVKNLPTRTFKGVKRKHWEALDGALNTARTLQDA